MSIFCCQVVDTRFRGAFAYVDATLTDGAVLPLMRLRYLGSARTWGFAIYLASNGKYQDSVLPSGNPTGTPEEALDCACRLYLADDPTAWETTPDELLSDTRRRHSAIGNISPNAYETAFTTLSEAA